MGSSVISIGELRIRAARLPRISLTPLPTPLQECPRLGVAVGRGARIFLKRDDLIMLGMGGNKVRKLEFSVAKALAEGCDVMVHGLAGQSNYCRQTAAAAAKVGLRCVLVLRRGAKDAFPPQANLLLDHIFGAEVHLVSPEEHARALEAMVAKLKAEGHRPYVVGHYDDVAGAVGYALCLAEILEQMAALGAKPDFVCVSGRTGTSGGLNLGKRILGFPGHVQSFEVSPYDAATTLKLRAATARYATEGAALLGLDETFTGDDIHNTWDYAGAAYQVPTRECLDTLFLLGRTEGLLVGPTYTAKGLSGVIDYIRTGKFPAGSNVVFVHTGGIPEVFGYNAEIIAHLGLKA